MKHFNGLKLFVSIFLLLISLSLFFYHCKSGEKIPKLTGEVDYNLLIIIIDTLRADRLGCYGFKNAVTPNIDKLVNNGVMFKNCYCSVPLTLPSHCTIFTGREPIAHHVRNNGTYVLNKNEITLAEILEQHQFQTYAVISSFILLSKFGLNQGFRLYDDSLSFDRGVNYTKTQIRADKVYAKFRDWLEKTHEKKFFSWVHFYDPHTPYDPPGEYGEKFKNDLYSGEISYVDHYIGKIIDDLEAKKKYDKTLIIVTSDHGEAFAEHKESGHGIFCYEESLKVPLIFHNPVIWKGKNVITRRVNLLDLLPTILHLFEIEIPAPVQGKSIAHLLVGKESEREKPSPQYFESMLGKEDMNWAPLTGIIVNQFKYISLPQPELYNLDNDPMEKENLIIKQKPMAEKLDKQLKKYIAAYQESSTPTKRKLTQMDRQKLKSLGYISSLSNKAFKSMDPKDGIVIVNKLNLAQAQITKGDIQAAEKTLTQLMSESPHSNIPPQTYNCLFDLYKKRGDLKKAKDILKKGISRFPNAIYLQIKLASLYFDLSKNHKAEELCYQILEQNSLYNQANLLLAKIYKKKGNLKEAEKFYENVLKIEPMNAKVQVEYAEVLFHLGKNEMVKKIISNLIKNDVLLNDSDNLNIKTRIGFLFLELGEYDKTINLYRRLLSLGQQAPPVLNQLGLAYFRKGNFDKALEYYTNALHMDRKNPLTLSNLGTLYLTLFRIQKKKEFLVQAIESYSKSNRFDPRHVSTLNGLAVAYSFSGDRKKAISCWQKAINMNPEFINIYFNLGITYIEIGKKKKALEYLKKCKRKFYSRLSVEEKRQLDRLINEASQL